jgi:RNA polymerase-binding transcription factor DksA
MDASSTKPPTPGGAQATDPRRLAALREWLDKRLAEIDAALAQDENLANQITATMLRGEMAKERERVDAALARLKQGLYGICCACETPLSLEQLHADPAIPFCMDCEMEIRETGRWSKTSQS